MVQTVKGLLTKADDPHLALLVYRSTPLPWCGYSPSQLLMGRRAKTNVPMVKDLLVLQLPDYQKFRQCDKEFKMSQKNNYDRLLRTHSLPPLPNDTEVWVTTEERQVPGQMISRSETPRSYVVQTDTGNVRRNRQHLTVVPDRTRQSQEQTPAPTTTSLTPRSPILTRSRTGTQTRPPIRFRKRDVGAREDT